MKVEYTSEDIIKMIHGAVEKIKANYQQLSKLDSVVGDGDHGSSMLRVANTIAETIDNENDGIIKSLLEKIGWAVMGVDGGSTGPLIGSLFSGMAEALGDSDTIDNIVLASMFSEALRKVQTLTKARPGDKTMIDALVPAVEKLCQAIEQGETAPAALQQAVNAAQNGAESTRKMQARFGRAKNLGERTIGHIDPGAMSIAYIFEGFASGINI